MIQLSAEQLSRIAANRCTMVAASLSPYVRELAPDRFATIPDRAVDEYVERLVLYAAELNVITQSGIKRFLGAYLDPGFTIPLATELATRLGDPECEESLRVSRFVADLEFQTQGLVEIELDTDLQTMAPRPIK